MTFLQRVAITVVTVGLLAVATVAMAIPPEGDPMGPEAFDRLQYKNKAGSILQYRLLQPKEDTSAGSKHPLLVFLHGAGERGHDNRAQLTWGAEFMLQAAGKYNAYVLVPQCPREQRWAEIDWSKLTHTMPKTPSKPMGLVMEVITKLRKDYPIDPARVYIMGLSMGGYGTWDTIQRYPSVFAAAVPICGGGDEGNASRITTPVWAFHGGDDRVVPVERSRRMIAAMEKTGAKPRYSEFPYVGHNSWSPAFATPELLPWIFSQRRTNNQ